MSDAKESEAVAFLSRTALEHCASGVWALFSGGDDSLATALVTSQAVGFRGCLHIDTGIGIPETQDFVVETCARQGWPLRIYRAKDCGQDYDALALERGFPGPAMHFKMYTRLKERPLRAFIREHKTHRRDRIVFSTGIRVSESQRRMGHAQQVRRDGVIVWANPIFQWSKLDCLNQIGNLPRNPASTLIHKSGECLCGCFAEPNELSEIALWFPKTAERIRNLEARVKAVHPLACQWGKRPIREKKRQPATRDSAGRRVGPLCQQCELNYEGADVRL